MSGLDRLGPSEVRRDHGEERQHNQNDGVLQVRRLGTRGEERRPLGEVEDRAKGEDHGQNKQREREWAATPHNGSPGEFGRAPGANTWLSSTISSRPSVDEDEACCPESGTVIREGVQTSESKVAEQEAGARIGDEAGHGRGADRHHQCRRIRPEIGQLKKAGGKDDRRGEQERESSRLLVAKAGNEAGRSQLALNSAR